MAAFRRLFFLFCFLLSHKLVAVRSVSITISPASTAFYTANYYLNCEMVNPSAVQQTLTITAFATGNFGYNTKNTSTTTLPLLNYTLAQYQSVNLNWGPAHTNGDNVPKFIRFDVAEPAGHVVGNCSIDMYGGNPKSYSLPINAGKPF